MNQEHFDRLAEAVKPYDEANGADGIVEAVQDLINPAALVAMAKERATIHGGAAPDMDKLAGGWIDGFMAGVKYLQLLIEDTNTSESDREQ